MTIIAGFKCQDGVVVCADTQETVGSISKRNVPKLRFERTGAVAKILSNALDISMAFCGAGHGPFIDKLVDGARIATKGAEDINAASEAIEDYIKNTYADFGRIYQPSQCPEVELIYGITVLGESRLFHATGPIVNQKDQYTSGGVGYYMADFLASYMYDAGITVQQAVVLAAYILFQAKEHVDGCGGDSHIAVLRENGKSRLIDAIRVDKITELLKRTNREIGKVLLASADFTQSKAQFINTTKAATNAIVVSREGSRKQLHEINEVWKALGFTVDEDDDDPTLLPS